MNSADFDRNTIDIEEPEQASEISQKTQETRDWAVLLHLSTLLGFAAPFLGFVVPIVIWQWKKPTLPGIDAHGKVVANAIISFLILALISIPLCFILIGFAFLGILCVFAVVFPIIGALKARDGEVWSYPFCFKFFQ